VVSTTGAGDAAVAGTIHGLLAGRGAVESARYGQAAAALTIASDRSVSPVLTARALAARVRACYGTA
ncbi:MAG: PfkB family carbohydrate kinase, partial [Dongiaceae bacterium]